MSLEELLREEVQKQIDRAIGDIPWATTKLSTNRAKLALQYKDISQCASLFQVIKQLTIIAIVDFNWTLAVYFVFI